jgi:hypothetical protein
MYCSPSSYLGLTDAAFLVQSWLNPRRLQVRSDDKVALEQVSHWDANYHSTIAPLVCDKCDQAAALVFRFDASIPIWHLVTQYGSYTNI